MSMNQTMRTEAMARMILDISVSLLVSTYQVSSAHLGQMRTRGCKLHLPCRALHPALSALRDEGDDPGQRGRYLPKTPNRRHLGHSEGFRTNGASAPKRDEVLKLGHSGHLPPSAPMGQVVPKGPKCPIGSICCGWGTMSSMRVTPGFVKGGQNRHALVCPVV
jgi:hypothetical protein